MSELVRGRESVDFLRESERGFESDAQKEERRERERVCVRVCV